MNILYLTNHLNTGGITSYVLTLAADLKKRGHTIYVASSGGELLPRFLEAGINYIPIPIRTKRELSLKIFASMFKLSALIKRYEIDIAHAHSRTTQVLGYLLARSSAVSYVSTCHGFFKRRFLRRIFPCWGEKVIAISEAVKEHLVEDFKVSEKDIRVIHNGVDVEKFRAQSTEHRVQKKKEMGLSEGPVVGIIARLSEEKGHVYLIEAIKKVLEKIPSAQLVIVGEGRQKEKLRQLAKSLGLENKVFFSPSLAKTEEILSVTDVFVLPSLKEGLGLALMEAMAAGCAVVGSGVGGIKSLIQDGETGLLVEPADSKALAAKIWELLQDAKRREILGRQARDFIARNFSLGTMVLETERLYLECRIQRAQA